MPGLSLGDVEAACLRTRRYIERGQEDALEFLSNPTWEGLERDRMIVDAAFFLLIFGQIEDRINALARRTLPARQHSSRRNLQFERRLALALPNDTALKSVVEDWYEFPPAGGRPALNETVGAPKRRTLPLPLREGVGGRGRSV